MSSLTSVSSSVFPAKRITAVFLMPHNLEIAQVKRPASREVSKPTEIALDVAPPVAMHLRA